MLAEAIIKIDLRWQLLPLCLCEHSNSLPAKCRYVSEAPTYGVGAMSSLLPAVNATELRRCGIHCLEPEAEVAAPTLKITG